MKKLKLQALQFGAKEILSRSQLKNVMGGDDGSGSTTSDYSCTGTCITGESSTISCTPRKMLGDCSCLMGTPVDCAVA
ncbi:TIGR04149 family rSAM-modified RiPP [Chitinophaga sp. LS1]|uniref:TIGR04149 family rSAM-modified RiPP n=1 Tax=Chitinophaga sp. LS1 TaxID=3051176 RepID=UPI0039F09CE2